jgi:hypothetical protein
VGNGRRIPRQRHRPGQINGFDFIARGAEDAVIGYIDNISFST